MSDDRSQQPTEELIGSADVPVPSDSLPPEPPPAEPQAAQPERLPAAEIEPALEPLRRDRRSNHAKQLEAIVAKRQERIQHEVDYARQVGLGEPTPTPVAAPETRPAEIAAAPAEPVVAPQPAPAVPPLPPGQQPQPPQGRVFRVTVRGQQIDMPEHDLVRAAELGIEAEARRREQDYYQQRQQQPAAPPAPPPAPAAPKLDDAALVELVRQIQFGEEEQAAAALRRIVEYRQEPQQQQPPLDPQQIAAQVYSRVAETQNIERQLMTFQAEYDDIVSDNALASLAANYVTAYRERYAQMGVPRTELDLMREAGNAVRADIQRWRGDPSGPTTVPPAPAAASPPPPPAANGARVAVKRSTPQAPAASAAPPANEQGPRLASGTTPSQAVDWMRRTRGQPVYR